MCKIDGWQEENGKIIQGTAFTLTPIYLTSLPEAVGDGNHICSEYFTDLQSTNTGQGKNRFIVVCKEKNTLIDK